MTRTTNSLKGGYYASPAKHTNATTARVPPDEVIKTIGFRVFRPSRQPHPAP